MTPPATRRNAKIAQITISAVLQPFPDPSPLSPSSCIPQGSRARRILRPDVSASIRMRDTGRFLITIFLDWTVVAPPYPLFGASVVTTLRRSLISDA